MAPRLLKALAGDRTYRFHQKVREKNLRNSA